MKTGLLAAGAAIVLAVGIWFWRGSKPVRQGESVNLEVETPAPAPVPAAESRTSTAKPPPNQVPSAPPSMSEEEFKHQLQSQFENAYNEGLDAEDAAAQVQFLNSIVAGFKLDDDQRRQVLEIQQAMTGELARAGNEAQKDRIYEEYAEKLGQVLGAGRRR